MRAAVLELAEELWAVGATRNMVATMAKRLGTGVDEVAFVLVGLLLEHQRRAARLSTAVRNALAEAEEAAAEVWREVG